VRVTLPSIEEVAIVSNAESAQTQLSSNKRHALKVVLFDIGNTLGALQNGKLVPFADTKAMLDGARALGLELGVLTNVPPDWDAATIKALLETAGLAGYFAPAALITSTDAGSVKPERAIYEYAANRVGVPPAACLFVGEDQGEIAGALATGMSAILKSRNAALTIRRESSA
jgi:FMN phosphatase YigB (HAD superfamily)